MATRRQASAAAHRSPPQQALTEHELTQLQQLLDEVPSPLEPLDVSMLDGFLCGVLLQPQRVAQTSWLPHVTDADGRPLPAGFDASSLHSLVVRRHAELDEAIQSRQWFDPWVFELEDDAAPAEAVAPWAAGFALAADRWPLPLPRGAVGDEALALIYQYVDPDDWPTAASLVDRIDELEPPGALSEAVEDLVRAVLLLSDLGGPRAIVARAPPRAGGPPKPRSTRG